ncbi:hypothetical protein [Luteimonas sp. 3794]|uniref:hypothetical protein n=1 Tax=Luteimonas sp. 3794 TaxID=2817730 RepID=UPI00285609C0|nr:hypothetical protein [Luteimonas sp. 3794]MDR6992464.1 hypothetical protein [Luteimonas sp. 3794]
MTSISRTDLFRLVWSDSLGKVGARFGVSDVAVAKACRKHGVPLPKQGHWAREAKSRDRKPKLPQVREAWLDTVYFDPPPPRDPALPVPESQSSIEVAVDLSKCKPIVRTTHRVLRKASEDKGLLIKPRNEVALDLRVSKTSLERALLIFDAIIRATEERGGRWEVTASETRLHALGGSIEINMLESRDQSFVPSEYSWLSREQRLTGNGKLAIRRGSYESSVSALRDSPKKPLESKIADTATALLERCARDREAKEERAREHLRHEQKQEAERQAARLKQEETIRLERLILAARAHEDARLIRELCRSTESAEGLDEERRSWLVWAHEEAARLDPIGRVGNPSELSVTEQDRWEAQRKKS